MPYQVLARAYRPRSFQEMVGQSHVVRPLQNALLSGRLHHAYLFCGTRGTGKTTVARVFAKALNCLDLQAGEPCNRCENCLEIDQGCFVDLIEIDAASRTKVEDTRDLLDNVPYMPAKGRFKIYLIDEVHMLSTHSFNALLKTLEEPPEHVKFLLCTTDPQKCPVTVLSRCLQFYLRHLSVTEITQHMQHILELQSLSFDSEALHFIADAARGSMRDALSLLDQAINFGAGSVKKAEVLEMLGSVDPEEIFQLLSHLLNQDIEAAFEFLNQFAIKSDAYEHLCSGLIQAVHELAMTQARPQYTRECSESRQVWIKKLSQACKPHELQLLYQFALMGQRDLQLAPQPKQGFEMLILRMISFVPLPSVQRLKEEASLKQESRSEERSIVTRVAEIQKPAVRAVAPATQSVTPKVAAGVPSSSSSVVPVQLQQNNSKVLALQDKLRDLNAENRAPMLRELVESLGLSGIAKQAMLHSELVSFDSHLLILSVSKQYQSLMGDHIKNQIEQVLRKLFSPSCKLEVRATQGEVLSPIKKEAQDRQEQQVRADVAIQQNEHVQFLQQTFGATILPGSVKKIESVKQVEE